MFSTVEVCNGRRVCGWHGVCRTIRRERMLGAECRSGSDRTVFCSARASRWEVVCNGRRAFELGVECRNAAGRKASSTVEVCNGHTACGSHGVCRTMYRVDKLGVECRRSRGRKVSRW